MNGYVCFFNGRRHEVRAATAFDARVKAVAFFRPAKSKLHMVSVVLAETAGRPVVHDPASLG